MHDVFISYSHKDKQIASAIVNVFEGRGIKCFIDYRDIAPGDDYAVTSNDEGEGSCFLIAFTSF